MASRTLVWSNALRSFKKTQPTQLLTSTHTHTHTHADTLSRAGEHNKPRGKQRVSAPTLHTLNQWALVDLLLVRLLIQTLLPCAPPCKSASGVLHRATRRSCPIRFFHLRALSCSICSSIPLLSSISSVLSAPSLSHEACPSSSNFTVMNESNKA